MNLRPNRADTAFRTPSLPKFSMELWSSHATPVPDFRMTAPAPGKTLKYL